MQAQARLNLYFLLMTIKRAHQFFTKHKLFTHRKLELAAVLELTGSENIQWYCDMGSFYHILLRYFGDGENVQPHGFVNYMTNNFPLNSNIIFVFDGATSEQKKETGYLRNAKRLKDAHKLVDFVSALDPKRKTSRAKWAELKKLRKRIWTPSRTLIKSIVEELTKCGFQVEVAEGEADVHIAKQTRSAAVSVDSDLFFHENIIVTAKPVFRGPNITYDVMFRSKVLQSLEISNDSWLALAVVSGNDYKNNIHGFGIASNYKLLKSFQNDLSTVQIVSKYCERLKVENSFKAALDIFCSRLEVLSLVESEAHKEFKALKEEALAGVDKFESDYEEWKKHRSWNRNDFSYLALKKNTRGYNRFLPLAKFEKGKLGRYRFHKVDTSKPTKSPVPAKPAERPAELNDREKKEQEDQENAISEIKTAEDEASVKDKKRKESKKKEDRGGYRLATAEARTLPKEDTSVKKRQLTDESSDLMSLKKVCAIKAHPIGSVGKHVKRGNLSSSTEFYSFTLDALTSAMEDLNLLKRAAQLGTKCLVESFAKQENPSWGTLRGICYSSNAGEGGKGYWQGVLFYLANQIVTGKQKNKAVLEFVNVVGKTPGLLALLKEKVHHYALKNAIGLLAIQLDTEFSNLVVGKIALLAAKVLEHDPSLEEEIEKIDSKYDKYDAIPKFIELNKLLPVSDQWSFPLSPVTNCYFNLDEQAMVSIIESAARDGKHTKIVRFQDEIKKLKEALKEKGRIIIELFGAKRKKYSLLEDYADFAKNYDLSPEEERPCRRVANPFIRASFNKRYVLSNTIVTNGKDFSVLILDLKESKTSSKTKPGTNLLSDARLLRKKQAPKSDFLTQLTKDQVDNLWIVGIDIGERYAIAGTAVKGFGENKEVRNFSVKSKALNEPQWRFREYLNDEKTKEESVYELERSMKRNEDEEMIDFILRYLQCYLKLTVFHNSAKMKKMRWDLDKAQRGEYDRLCHALLVMVNAGIHSKSKGDVVFCLGNAQFESKGTVHRSFEKYFVKKIRSLGYPVLYLNEFMTSQKAPCCGSQAEFFGFRVKYCRHCHKFFHRDVMAGENLVNVARAFLLREGRPEYLTKKKPPDKVSGVIKKRK
jgi:hypothetical protein